jgi:adenylate cyclase
MDEPLTAFQRASIRQLRKKAGRAEGEPLEPDDWELAWYLHEHGTGRGMSWFLRHLPSGPRCSVCAAPFGGIGKRIVGPLGFRPSRKNPEVCSTCVESSPPGGLTMFTGVLFADLRSFTSSHEHRAPREAAQTLRRFYRAAEDVLFPEAVIDKLIGDEVMGLYLPELTRRFTIPETAGVMLRNARRLLHEAGDLEIGIGLDVGDAYVGNIGDRALYDFTAVGDVVNTASRLQHEARAGEIVLSERVARALDIPPGAEERLTLKGKAEPVTAYRISDP